MHTKVVVPVLVNLVGPNTLTLEVVGEGDVEVGGGSVGIMHL